LLLVRPAPPHPLHGVSGKGLDITGSFQDDKVKRIEI
jgi:hypothetical protein